MSPKQPSNQQTKPQPAEYEGQLAAQTLDLLRLEKLSALNNKKNGL